MRFAPHWARVALDEQNRESKHGPFVAFGWSFEGMDGARAMARERAERLRRWVLHYDEDPPEPEEDYYPTDGDVMREVVLEEGERAGLRWAITRNQYGAQVLNVDGMAILDVDIRHRLIVEPAGFLGRLFGFRRRRWESDPPNEVLARLRAQLASTPFGGRIYRTNAGFRVIILDRPLRWDDPEFHALMQATDTDRLYAALCERQKCCRARLTPKPWRVGMSGPDWGATPTPWAPNGGPTWAEWLRRYQSQSAETSVAHFAEAFGPDQVHADLQAAFAVHERCVGTAPLA